MQRDPDGVPHISSAKSFSSRTRAVLRDPAAATSELLAVLQVLPLHKLRMLAQAYRTKPRVFELLAKHSDLEVRNRVAKNPNTPPRVLAELTRDEECGVRFCAVENQSTPSEALVALAGLEKDPEFKVAVASNPSTPAMVLAELAALDANVRRAVGGNSRTPDNILVRLASDPEVEVRLAVAGNWAAPMSALALLGESFDDEIDRALASNPHTPPELLRSLASWSGPRSVDQLSYFDSEEFSLEESVAMQAELAVFILRSAVAENPGTPLDALALLVGGGFAKNVVQNPNAPANLLKRCAKWLDRDLRETIAYHPNTDPILAAQLKQLLRR